MLTNRPVAEQIRAAAHDRIRVLVVGAGVAGLTAAQLLRREGLNPVLVERSDAGADPGYMLALMPMVDAAFDRLGVRDEYLAASVELRRYRFRSHTGRPLREDALGDILKDFGQNRGISRARLLAVLAALGGAVTHRTTVESLHETADRAEVVLRSPDGPVTAEFDLVIAADGIHSATRDLIFPGRGVDTVDTGWGGWVVWVGNDADPELGEELWGVDFFIGSYPVRERMGVLVGGPRSAETAGPAAFAAHIRSRLATRGERIDRTLDALAAADAPFYWPMADARAASWTTPRTVLLGDAAAGFLPTAGIGAGMAIESAWMLAGAVCAAPGRDLGPQLREYERVQRPRVEAAQQTSRRLAGLMFRSSRPIAVLRDAVLRFVSVEAAIGPIKRLLAERAVPPGAARPGADRR